MIDPLEATRRAVLRLLYGAPAAAMASSSRAASARGDERDPARSPPTDEVTFKQAGQGAVTRAVQAKLQDVVSVRDYGAVGDAKAQDKDAFTRSAGALTTGGPIDIARGTYRIGEQFLGPARGNVHAYDCALIGDKDIVRDGRFAASPALGWSLVGFALGSLGLTHAKGAAGGLKQTVSVRSYTTYLITLTAKTTARGGVAFFLDGEPLFTERDYSILPVGADSYKFSMFSYLKEGELTFELRSDADWAGTIESLSIIEVSRETPYDFFSIAADKRDFDNIFGIKFGRFLSGNIAIGDRLTSALLSHDAAWNVAIGSRALSTTIDGFENTAIGALALEFNQVDRNTAGGYSAFRYNTKGIQNTGWGYKTFGRNSIGSNNTGVGFWASLYNQTGSNNCSVGALAGYYNSHGSYNSAFGSQAGVQNDGGKANTFVGAIAGPYTPGASTFSYSYSTCIGAESKGYGDNTTAVGYLARCGSDPHSAGAAIVTSAAAFGCQALAAGDRSVAVGGASAAQAEGATAVGEQARAIGASSVALGYLAQAGDRCAAVGAHAGQNLGGAENLSLGEGANSFPQPTNYSNATAIGHGARCTGSAQVTLGNEAVREIRAAVSAITAISDRRDKANIGRLDGRFASAFLKSITPVRWDWAMRGATRREGGEVGFVAQDLAAAQAAHDADWLKLVNDADPERLESTPGRLIPLLVAALQSALERIEALERRR